ncbi:hypothetical protein [Anthocerotibacter panamensis]|uniref:hypothetical protein n=1 Tax=Anthocerotibacter panamensis TaxID=2857077 RepID=UPI001C40156A|nr:hypothetical protein [Anthocerotibacter panamensis]
MDTETIYHTPYGFFFRRDIYLDIASLIDALFTGGATRILIVWDDGQEHLLPRTLAMAGGQPPRHL